MQGVYSATSNLVRPRSPLARGRETTLGTKLYCNMMLALFLNWFSFLYRKFPSSARFTQKDIVYHFAELFSTYFAHYVKLTPETMLVKSINEVIYRNCSTHLFKA